MQGALLLVSTHSKTMTILYSFLLLASWSYSIRPKQIQFTIDVNFRNLGNVLSFLDILTSKLKPLKRTYFHRLLTCYRKFLFTVLLQVILFEIALLF